MRTVAGGAGVLSGRSCCAVQRTQRSTTARSALGPGLGRRRGCVPRLATCRPTPSGPATWLMVPRPAAQMLLHELWRPRFEKSPTCEQIATNGCWHLLSNCLAQRRALDSRSHVESTPLTRCLVSGQPASQTGGLRTGFLRCANAQEKSPLQRRTLQGALCALNGGMKHRNQVSRWTARVPVRTGWQYPVINKYRLVIRSGHGQAFVSFIHLIGSP
jgi:hypothetical protein